MRPTLSGGRNIAQKVPPHQFEATVAFYRDVLGLALIEALQPSVVFEFGPNRLWIDPVDGLSQAEIWLELVTDDTDLAARHLEQAGVVRCDEIERLPEGFGGFWISSPASIIHLVSAGQDDPLRLSPGSSWDRRRGRAGRWPGPVRRRFRPRTRTRSANRG